MQKKYNVFNEYGRFIGSVWVEDQSCFYAIIAIIVIILVTVAFFWIYAMIKLIIAGFRAARDGNWGQAFLYWALPIFICLMILLAPVFEEIEDFWDSKAYAKEQEKVKADQEALYNYLLDNANSMMDIKRLNKVSCEGINDSFVPNGCSTYAINISPEFSYNLINFSVDAFNPEWSFEEFYKSYPRPRLCEIRDIQETHKLLPGTNLQVDCFNGWLNHDTGKVEALKVCASFYIGYETWDHFYIDRDFNLLSEEEIRRLDEVVGVSEDNFLLSSICVNPN